MHVYNAQTRYRTTVTLACCIEFMSCTLGVILYTFHNMCDTTTCLACRWSTYDLALACCACVHARARGHIMCLSCTLGVMYASMFCMPSKSDMASKCAHANVPGFLPFVFCILSPTMTTLYMFVVYARCHANSCAKSHTLCVHTLHICDTLCDITSRVCDTLHICVLYNMCDTTTCLACRWSTCSLYTCMLCRMSCHVMSCHAMQHVHHVHTHTL